MSVFEISSPREFAGTAADERSGFLFFLKGKKRRRTTSGTGGSYQSMAFGDSGNQGGAGTSRSPRRKKKGASVGSVLLILLLIIFLLGLAGVLVVGYMFYQAHQELPPWDPTKLSSASNSLMYDSQGELIYELHSGENRREITLSQVPQDLLDALLATEDRNYYTHHGIDVKGIVRSVVVNFTSGKATQGASTLTQQLARNSFLTLEKTVDRKLKEILLAFKIESEFSKNEILTFYLNKMNFGAGAYGIQAAASTYFGKDVSELNLPQCAMLVGLLQAPSAYNPLIYYDKAKARQEVVLQNMVAAGYITEREFREARVKDLEILTEEESRAQNLQTSDENTRAYGFYIDAAIEEAAHIFEEIYNLEDGESAIYSSGLSIHTNLDKKIQNQMNAVFADDSYFPTITHNGLPVQAASVVVENASGKVLALMGGREYQTARGFNRATHALRQPGSCIKPLTVYSPALESGVMPFTVFDDAPISYYLSNGSYWSPKNYDLTYKGLITMRTAVQWSVNTYAVLLLDQIGVRTGFDYGRSLGLPLVDTPGTNDLGLAPLALGGLTYGVTPLQMAGAYAALGNEGVYNEPHLITRIYDEDGALIYMHENQSELVFSRSTAWLMTSMLQTVTSSGTGTPGKVPYVPTAGKTGTSEEKSNAWFCGYTPKYTCTVWFGFDEVHAMPGVYGSDAAKVFRSILTTAHEGIEPGSFDSNIPSNIVSVTVCKLDGKLIAANTPPDDIITEYCVSGYAPTEYSDAYVDVVLCANTQLLPNTYCPSATTAVRKGELPTDLCTACQIQVPLDYTDSNPLFNEGGGMTTEPLPGSWTNPSDLSTVIDPSYYDPFAEMEGTPQPPAVGGPFVPLDFQQ